MTIKTLLNFEFKDGEVSMHVSVTEYSNGSCLVSHSNTICDEAPCVSSVRNKVDAMAMGNHIRTMHINELAIYLAESATSIVDDNGGTQWVPE